MSLPDITHLRTVVLYNPATGVISYLPRENDQRSFAYSGKEAGKLDGRGYRQIRVEGHVVLAHRLAWALMTNEWPESQIDHINGDTLDNRWINLRLATRSQNMANTKLRRDNKTGFKGVVRSRTPGKFYAQIGFHGRTINLGTFDSAEEAAQAYRTAAREKFNEFTRS
jgi:hypothetical protein